MRRAAAALFIIIFILASHVAISSSSREDTEAQSAQSARADPYPTTTAACAAAAAAHNATRRSFLADWARDTSTYRATQPPWREWRITDPDGVAPYPLTAPRLSASRGFGFDPAPLQRVLRRMERGGSVTVGFVGGSNTNGKLWRGRMARIDVHARGGWGV